LDEFTHAFADVGVEAEAIERDEVLAEKDSENNLFALGAREGSCAQVDWKGEPWIERELTVLRHSTLRDIHSGEDFYPRDDLGGDVKVDAGLFDKCAINAESDLNAVSFGLDVDIAGALVDSASDEIVEDDNSVAVGECRRGSGGGRSLDGAHEQERMPPSTMKR